MKQLFLFLISFSMIGCTSKLIIQSDPPEVEVHATVEGRADKVKLGVTPFEMTEVQLAEQMKISPESVQWIDFEFAKKDFMTRNLFVPSSRWGEASKVLKVNMKPSSDQSTLAKKIVNYFFNAKKYAETKQFELAHAEIDKILEIDSSLAQAITMKASVFYLQNKLDDAKKLYRQALSIDPGSTDAIQMLERIESGVTSR